VSIPAVMLSRWFGMLGVRTMTEPSAPEPRADSVPAASKIHKARKLVAAALCLLDESGAPAHLGARVSHALEAIDEHLEPKIA